MDFSPKKKLIVFTGAGVSAESGIRTFRDSGGLWENYDIMDVATPEAWERQPKVVLDFYNARRKQVLESEPNEAHKILASLESDFDVSIITQNIDDLHERAGSTNILHLHGEIMKSKSSLDHSLIYPIEGPEIKWGELCEKGSQLRPHVVWFGEPVHAMYDAEKMLRDANIMIVIGTSLNVYPAAGLVYSAPRNCTVYLIDPGDPLIPHDLDIEWIKEKAGRGLEILREMLHEL